MIFQNEIDVAVDGVVLKGDLTLFVAMKALVIFAHGSGSSRKSPRNQQVASDLNENGFGTFLFDLLTPKESSDRKLVFDIAFLGRRLAAVTQWLRVQPQISQTPFAYFGASTGAGAAIYAANLLEEIRNHKTPHDVYAIVSRGGRPDLAGQALKTLAAPTLLIVGGDDDGVIELNELAQSQLSYSRLSIIPGATHLFEEPGTLEEISRQASAWFAAHLSTVEPSPQARKLQPEIAPAAMMQLNNKEGSHP